MDAACHCVHPKKTLTPWNLWSIVSGLVRVFLLSRVYPLTTWSIECMNKGSLSEPHTATPLILKPVQPILHEMPPEQTLICYWNVLDLCRICLWMFVGIYHSPGMGFSDRLPPFAPCDHRSFHQICSSPASSPNLLGKMKSVYRKLINGLDPTTVAYSLFQSSMKCLTTNMKWSPKHLNCQMQTNAGWGFNHTCKNVQ